MRQLVIVENNLFKVLPPNFVKKHIINFQMKISPQQQSNNIPKIKDKITFIKNKYNYNDNSSFQINQHTNLSEFSYNKYKIY